VNSGDKGWWNGNTDNRSSEPRNTVKTHKNQQIDECVQMAGNGRKVRDER